MNKKKKGWVYNSSIIKLRLKIRCSSRNH